VRIDNNEIDKWVILGQEIGGAAGDQIDSILRMVVGRLHYESM